MKRQTPGRTWNSTPSCAQRSPNAANVSLAHCSGALPPSVRAPRAPRESPRRTTTPPRPAFERPKALSSAWTRKKLSSPVSCDRDADVRLDGSLQLDALACGSRGRARPASASPRPTATPRPPADPRDDEVREAGAGWVHALDLIAHGLEVLLLRGQAPARLRLELLGEHLEVDGERIEGVAHVVQEAVHQRRDGAVASGAHHRIRPLLNSRHTGTAVDVTTRNS